MDHRFSLTTKDGFSLGIKGVLTALSWFWRVFGGIVLYLKSRKELWRPEGSDIPCEETNRMGTKWMGRIYSGWSQRNNKKREHKGRGNWQTGRLVNQNQPDVGWSLQFIVLFHPCASGWERENYHSVTSISHECSQMEEEEDRPSESARSFRGFEDERQMEAETGKSDGWMGVLVVRTERQYLPGWERVLAGGRTERRSLSPRLHCQPTPNDAPARRHQRGSVTTPPPPKQECMQPARELPRLLQCGQWWSPAFHGGNIWGLPPRSRPWKRWLPAWSCLGCCRFSEPQGSETNKQTIKVRRN